MKLHEMTWPEVKQAQRDKTLVVAPIAACEQHSLHLPTFTDSLICGALAERMEAQLPQSVLLLPVLWLGASDHHLPFGATLSARLSTHTQMLCDLLTPLLHDGFWRFLVLNGHGGNLDSFRSALRRLQPDHPKALLTAASYWELAAPEIAAICEGPRKSVGHACEVETALMLHLHPELVRKIDVSDAPDIAPEALRGLYIAKDYSQRSAHGAAGFPRFASPQNGKRLLEIIGKRIYEVAACLLEQPRPLPETVR